MRAVAVTLVLVLAGSASRVEAQERFYQAYDDGIKAFNAGDLSTAERLFQRALQLDSRQSRQKRTYGMEFRVYIPEYYLGLVAARQKQYQRAASYFSRVEQAGLVKKGDREYETLVAERLAAENGLRPAPVVANAAPPPTAPVTTTPPPTQKPTPSAPTTATQPSNTASTGSNANAAPVEPARTTPAPVAAAPPPPIPVAVEPRTAPGANVKEIQTSIARLLAARDYEKAWELAGRPSGATAPAGFTQEQQGRIRSTLTRDIRDQMARPNLAEASRLVETLSRLAPRDGEAAGLQRELRDLRALLTAEREALSLLLKGDYTEAIRGAARLLDDKRESPRLLFYTACGHAGLALLGSDDAAVHSEKARELALKTTLAAGTFQKEARYISPQILDLLRNASR